MHGPQRPVYTHSSPALMAPPYTSTLLASRISSSGVSPGLSWGRVPCRSGAAAGPAASSVWGGVFVGSKAPPFLLVPPRQPRGEREVRVSWSREEDAVIVASVAELGHKWCATPALLLPRRRTFDTYAPRR